MVSHASPWPLFCIFFFFFPLLVISGNSFSHYIFALQWPPSFCKRGDLPTSCELPVPQDFKIHGLWPHNMSSESPPPSCDPSNKFDYSQIQHLEPRLSQNWPDLLHLHGKAGNSTSAYPFWEYEWNTHGTCSGLSQDLYFEKALDLYDNINPLQELKAMGFIPGAEAKYKPMDIISQWQRTNKYNVYPSITCVYVKQEEHIGEIRFSISTDGVTVLSMTGILSTCSNYGFSNATFST